MPGRLSRQLARCRNISDLRRLAEKKLPAAMFHYIDGAAEDEWTARANIEAFDQLQFVPRSLVNVDNIDTSTEVLGQTIKWPVICAPTGMSRLFHHDGERAVARAAATAGTLYSLSSMSSVSIEDVADVSEGPKMFQIYVFRDRDLNKEFIRRCKAKNYAALCLTVDVAVPGNRERDLRTGMTIPPTLTLASLVDFALHPRWVWNHLTKPSVLLENVRNSVSAGEENVTTLAQYIQSQFDPTVTWSDAAWMIEEWDGPFAVKGIMTASDARRAVDIGASAIVVSNHGGRQLDALPAAIDALPAIVDAAGSRVEVILDGGIRRGTHVLKALAMGANACMIGRPYLYGLGAGGEAGVARVLDILKSEIERDMALLGCRTISDISSDMVSYVRNSQSKAGGSISDHG